MELEQIVNPHILEDIIEKSLVLNRLSISLSNFWCGALCSLLGVYVLVFVDLCVILMLTVVCLNMCVVTLLLTVFSRMPKTNFS